MFTQKNFYSSPASRYLMLLLAWMLCSIIGSFVMALVMGDGTQAGRMRIAIVVQDILMFILPALLTAVFITSRPAELLGVTRRFPPSALLLVFMIMVVSAPAMNILISFNQSLTLPESLKPIEEWMRHSEESAAHSLSLVTGSTSVGSLIISILIVGILAGFSEEIFFRGALQRIMATGGVSAHAAIWIAAFIFSAFHMQFFGFLPRLLLGAFFGYLLWWSGSLWLPVCAHALNN
ncbi:MAG: CPBP family intramembrane metalloprotease, partial [Paramuribaculum sp.]|nr:CPBP family intramembrane metalloprotease [Paramuribaculum sp.]